MEPTDRLGAGTTAPQALAQPSREPSTAEPVVSVVVPTFHRPVLLARCLEALLDQRLADRYEIVVADDGHSEATRDQVERLLCAAPPRVTLRYLRPAAGRGPAVARNAGWRAARATLIAFTDDDTLAQPDWLAQGVHAMRAAGENCAALSGRVIVPPGEPPARPAEGPGGGPRQPLPTDHELMTRGLETAEFVTANAFVRRDALVRVDGFDERFRRAWREDSDLQFRLQAQVGPVGRCAEAAVLHPVRPERWGVSLRQQKNVFYDALLYRKHPRLYRERVRAAPPWDYFVIVAATFLAACAALLAATWPARAAGVGVAAGTVAAALAALALVLVLRFAARRLRVTARSPRHVVEMLATSALIPFLSVYWRLRGALHFRVWFL